MYWFESSKALRLISLNAIIFMYIVYKAFGEKF